MLWWLRGRYFLTFNSMIWSIDMANNGGTNGRNACCSFDWQISCWQNLQVTIDAEDLLHPLMLGPGMAEVYWVMLGLKPKLVKHLTSNLMTNLTLANGDINIVCQIYSFIMIYLSKKSTPPQTICELLPA